MDLNTLRNNKLRGILLLALAASVFVISSVVDGLNPNVAETVRALRSK